MNTFVEIAATVTDACFMAWFVPKFCGVPIKQKYWTLVFPLTYCVLQLIFDTFLTAFNVIPVVMVFVLAAVFSLLLMRGHYIWSLFCSSCYGLIMMLTNTLLFVFFSVYLEDVSVILPGSNMGMRTLFLIIAKIALFIFYKLIVILFSLKVLTTQVLNIGVNFLSLGIIAFLFLVVGFVLLDIYDKKTN